MVFVAVLLGLLGCMVYYLRYGSQEKMEMSRTVLKNGVVSWDKNKSGIIGTSLTDYVGLEQQGKSQVIVRARNVAAVKAFADTIRIGFFGLPDLVDAALPVTAGGFHIIADTGYSR